MISLILLKLLTFSQILQGVHKLSSSTVVDGWMDGWIDDDGWMDRWIDRWMDGLINWLMDLLIYWLIDGLIDTDRWEDLQTDE